MRTKAIGLSILLLAGTGSAQTSFTEVTGRTVRGRTLQARGMAFGDYDNDGWLDMFLSDSPDSRPSGPYQPAFLHNEGDGAFAEPKPALWAEGLADRWQGGGTVFGDYDNDGDLDLFLPIGAYAVNQRFPDVLLRNDQGVFADVTLAAAGSTSAGFGPRTEC